MGSLALVAIAISFVLASCSKGEDDAHTTEVAAVDSTADSTTTTPVTSYAVSENEQIMFSSRGIIDVINNQTDSPQWVLSYREIAKRLDIEFSKVSSIKITRDQVLDNGLWRFDVSFDGQQDGTAYGIDVDITDGEIEWVHSIEGMPGGDVFTLNIN